MMSVFSFPLLNATLFWSISLAVLRLSKANFIGNETDRLALLAFKSQITGDLYNVTSSWNDSNHFCDWEGVTCSNRHQRVTVLNLASKGLVGPISTHIGNLSFLKTLVLQNNGFHGEIPKEIGHLFRLEDLVLSNNSLAGNIPVNISRCSNLKTLILNRNNLVGKIPMELGSLLKLVELSFRQNNLTGVIPPSFGNLTSLEVLQLSQNSLGGSIPSTLDQLKSLKKLGLGQCMLSGMFPPNLYNHSLETISIEINELSGYLPTDFDLLLPNLKIFFIEGNKFSGPIPASFTNASGLEQFDMGYNQFTGPVPLNMGNLKGLTILVLQENKLGSGKSGDLDFLTSLTNCTNLQELGISANQFGGMLPATIANFSTQLEFFSLDENQISGNIPSEIGNLQSLTLLKFYNNFITGNIPMGIGKLQNLGLLYLFGNRISGHIPSSMNNMSQLFDLALSFNFLEGSIASSLGNQMLQMLDLSYNNFSGIIPHEIGLSSRLQILDLSHNSLIGSIPSELGSLKSLEYMNVSENKMAGEIPSTIGGCSSLENLYLQGNFFQGALPHSLSYLQGLQVLDVSRNNITGMIPKELENLRLQSLNLSFNNIEGEVPQNGIFQNATAISIAGNYKLCGGVSTLQLPKCIVPKSSKKEVPLALKVTLGVLIPLLFLVVLFLVIYWNKKPKAKPPTEQVQGVVRVSYNDLHKATNGFSSANLIGMGGYGSVYKGILSQDEEPIAVKVFNLLERRASKSFIAECEALRTVRHRNLLKILTVCSSEDFRGNKFKALVFEFMPNGSLESWLHPSSNEQDLPRFLNFYERLNIAIDVASALDYLHNQCERPIVHCDLKSSNVLLSNDMTAHVGDFGLAKFLSKSTSTSNNTESNSIAIRGTIGYIPPEYGMGTEVSAQGDVYSYGVLLLEMFTAKRPTDDMLKDGFSLHLFCKMALPHKLLEVIDMRLLSEETQSKAPNVTNHLTECLSSVMRIGVKCSEELLTERMDIQDVLNEMHSIKKVFLSCINY